MGSRAGSSIDKQAIAKAIGEGRWREYGQEAVFDYCEEDVQESVQAVARAAAPYCDQRGRTLLPAADVPRVLHWSNYSAKAGRANPGARHADRHAAVEFGAGKQDRPSSASCCGSSIRATAAKTRSTPPTANGATSRFERWLVRIGCTHWPRLESGKLDIDGDAFRMMYHIPGIEGLHALTRQHRLHRRARLPIGPDGRNRPSLFPFCTATGRNAHAKSPFNAHAGMRSFMRVPARHDRRLSRLADARGRCCRRRLQRPRADGRLSRRRCLSRARAICAAYQRPRPKALEETTTGNAAAHEGAAARRSTTGWACHRWRGD